MIKNQTRTGSRVLIALVVIAVVVAAFVIVEIRFGGPIERKHALNDEMLADILPPPAFVVEPYLEASLAAADPKIGPQSLKRIGEIQAEFRERKAYWATAPVPEELRPQLNRTLALADKFFETANTYLVPAIESRDRAAIGAVLIKRLTPIYQRQHSEVIRLVAMSRDFDRREKTADNRMVALCLAFGALIAIVLIGAISAASSFIRRRVIVPLDETYQTIGSLADGDYAISIRGLSRTDEFGAMARAMEIFRKAGIVGEQSRHDQERVVEILSVGLDKLAAKDLEHQIGDDFPESYAALRHNYNAALEAFATAMGAVRVGASSVMNSISEIRSATDDLAIRNEQQAASLEETAAAMRQVTGRVNDATASTLEAQKAIGQAQNHADQGGEVVRKAIDAMAAIEHSAQEIASIVDVIDGIAFQTNLLALNAGVEAARAGDSGKGFAVVANEVRELAQRSATAAQNIKDLINKSSSQVSDGVCLVDQTGEKFGEIATQIAGVNTLMGAISDAAKEQAANLQQVNLAVTDMDRMTQQNAAMVEETTAGTRSLETEAAALTKMMATFRTRVKRSRPDIVGDVDAHRRSTIANETFSAHVAVGAAA